MTRDQFAATLEGIHGIAMTIDAEHCRDCGRKLMADERAYLERQCSRCALDMSDRLEAWRMGANDPELDRHFSVEAVRPNRSEGELTMARTKPRSAMTALSEQARR